MISANTVAPPALVCWGTRRFTQVNLINCSSSVHTVLENKYQTLLTLFTHQIVRLLLPLMIFRREALRLLFLWLQVQTWTQPGRSREVSLRYRFNRLIWLGYFILLLNSIFRIHGKSSNFCSSELKLGIDSLICIFIPTIMDIYWFTSGFYSVVLEAFGGRRKLRNNSVHTVTSLMELIK